MGADGSIKIAIEVDGKQVDVASKSLDNLETAGNDAGKGVGTAEDSLKDVGKESTKASGNIKKFATALGLVAIGAAAFQTLKASMDDAISRFDTLNQFPKVLQALGVSAEDSERAMEKLSDGIDGLPTKLDEISSTAQRMYTSFDDMDKATDTALALNNALLGSGSSAADAQRGTEQYLKVLQTGKVEMDTWQTLSETMDVGLVKIAESFGFAGKSAKNDLYKALQDGSITIDEFNDKLIEIGTGTGEMAKLAKENTLGIATSLGNLKNAAARGIANIIDSFNKLSREVTGKDIAENIDSLKGIVNASFKVIQGAIEATTPFFKAFGNVVSATIPVIKKLSPVLIGMATAFAMNLVISKTNKALQDSKAVTYLVITAQDLFTAAIKKNTAARMANTIAEKASLIAGKARNKFLVASTTAELLLTKQIKLSTLAKTAGAAASRTLGKALKFMTGPVGWVTAGIGALAGAVVGIVKWFNKATEEGERLTEETEKMTDSVDSLNNEVEQSAEAYKKNQSETKAAAKANEELASKVEDLAAKENKSAAEKEMLNSYIEQLNGSVEGLNLAYDAEANALNMSSEKMQARIDLMKEQEKAQEAQERLTEILAEQAEVEGKLAETNDLREEWNQKLEDGSVKASEHKDEVEKLDEKEKELKETIANLGNQQAETEEQFTTSMEAITEATQNGVTNQIIKFEELSESQQETIESMKSAWEGYKEKATDMFNTLSEKSEISVQEMTTNLQENQRIISEWSENIATLAERGVDEGLLNTLREAGPESAGHVNALVNASDEELANLSEAFSKGGETATNALSKSLGIEESGVMEAVGHLVTGMEESLSQKIKSANFESIGRSAPEGMAGGIEKGSKQAENASEKMADDTANSAKKALDSHSPSRVFKRIGIDVTEGLVLGINNGTSKVIQAVRKMFDSVLRSSNKSFKSITKGYDRSVKIIENSLKKLPEITQKSMKNMFNRLKSGANAQTRVMKILATKLVTSFNRTKGQLRSVGSNAMAGLNQGLRAGSGRVMSTARSIANRVAGTMRNALRIHSPSRLMRDDVGKWIPEGIAVGIKDNAKSVYKELDKLSSGMMLASTPEKALGTSKMAYTSSRNQVTNALKGVQMPVANINREQKIVIEPADVLIDGHYAGKVLWRPVKENIDRDEGVKNSFRGST
ncbi:tape measure protein [Virgibacillus salarius]|uniref:tape measure protein n=1 Tax=Virgibacillus salarius TaxID=447199 RepID=UPI002492C48C|nr:tape measure protein [Virgibacillus salarius]WBX81287.1 tape measure protein [Virgibacillus salarius]